MGRSPGPGEIWERAAFGSVLLFAMGASTFIVFALGALGPLITDDLSLSRSLFGGLCTAMLAISAVVSPFSGHMVDLFGGRKAVLALFLIAAVTAAGIALAPSYPLMLGVAPLAGLAISLANPSTNKLLAENPGPSGQGVILGIKQSGVHIAGLLAGVILPVAAVNLGWRLPLFLCAVTLLTGCVMAILWLPRDDVTRAVRVHTGSRPIAHVVGWLSGYGFPMGMS